MENTNFDKRENYEWVISYKGQVFFHYRTKREAFEKISSLSSCILGLQLEKLAFGRHKWYQNDYIRKYHKRYKNRVLY